MKKANGADDFHLRHLLLKRKVCVMKQQHKGSITSKEMRVFPYLLILPNFLIFTIFIIVPAIFGIYYSLTDWSGIGDLNFIGLENYAELLGDTRFWLSVRQTFIYALIALPLIVMIPLLLATQLVKSIRCRSFFRAVFYWPSMISYIVVGLLFQFIFGDSTGVINYLLSVFHFSEVSWFTNGITAMAVVILASVWSRSGFYMVTFISGLTSIDDTYYEAAEVDGASSFRKFWSITLPLLKPTTFLVIILGFIDLFKQYGLVLTLTNGGPAGMTKFAVQYIYEEAFQRFELGYASALSMVLMVILAVLTLVQFKLNKGGAVNE